MLNFNQARFQYCTLARDAHSLKIPLSTEKYYSSSASPDLTLFSLTEARKFIERSRLNSPPFCTMFLLLVVFGDDNSFELKI